MQDISYLADAIIQDNESTSFSYHAHMALHSSV